MAVVDGARPGEDDDATRTSATPSKDGSSADDVVVASDVGTVAAATNVPDDAAHVDTQKRPLGPLGVIGRFRLERRLGSGGMAHVYRAYDPALDRAVALKVLRVSKKNDGERDEAQQRRRVLREARAAAALVHPNTVTIFDVGEADGEVFIAMELLEGEPLRAAMLREKNNPEASSSSSSSIAIDQKMQWLTQAARALSAAHERSLVHRDVKPDNIFVCKDGTLKLLDFGIAKRPDAHDDDDDNSATTDDPKPDSIGPSSLRTEAGVRVGTPRYMAPEQHAGQPTDARTDEYAWGLVAFELLTGTHPIAAPVTVTKSAVGTGSPAISSENVAAFLATTPHVTSRVASVIARALATRKEDRFPSMASLLEALEENAVSSASASASASAPAPAAQATPETKQRASLRESSNLKFVVALAIAGVLGLGIVLGAKHASTSSSETERQAATAAAEGICHVENLRSVAVGADDRVAGLPNGDVAIARNIRQGLVLTRLAKTAAPDAAAVTFTTHPAAVGMLKGIDRDFVDVSLVGVPLNGGSWVLTVVDQVGASGSLVLAMTDTNYFAQRLWAPISGMSVTPFGSNRVLFGVTTTEAVRYAGLPSGAELYISDGITGARPINIERGSTFAPSIATNATGDRIAFAFALEDEPQHQRLELAILDEAGERTSDVKTVHAAPSITPAVGFAGKTNTAAVFWIENIGQTTRLNSATYTPGSSSQVTPPKVATPDANETVATHRPLTARLPSREWVILWVSMQHDTPTLRVAPIGEGGVLGSPTNIATLPKFEDLVASSTNDGVVVQWREIDAKGSRTAKIADVTCANLGL